MEDFYLPVRGGDTSTRIETTKGLEYDGTNDVVYLRDKLFAALKIPKAYFGYEGELNGKATLSMKPHFYELDSVVLDAKGMEIKSVTHAGKELSYDYSDGNVLTVYLRQSYKKHELITLTIDYIAKPEER